MASSIDNINLSSPKAFLENVSKKVLLEIQRFLLGKEYYRLLVSSHSFKQIKYETWLIQMKDDCVKFLTDADFRATILSKIQDPQNQLIISLNVNPVPVTYAETLRQIPAARLEMLRNANHLNEEWIHLFPNYSRGLKIIRNNTIESFQNCIAAPVIYLEGFSKLTDLTQFSNLQELFLRECDEIVNASPLKNLKKLSIVNAPKLTNVNELGNIYELFLNNCPLLEDISKLTNNYKLTIKGCPKIKSNLSSLKNIPHLTTDLLTKFNQVTKLQSCLSLDILQYRDDNITIPGTVKYLSIQFWKSGHKNIYFSSLQSLKIDSAGNEFINLLPFSEIPYLSFEGCHILSLQGISSNKQKSITLHNCLDMTDFSPLNGIRKVILSLCNGFNHAHQIPEVYDLSIIGCDSLVNVLPLSTIYHLELINCSRVHSLKD
jgi:hypothetical protein